MGKLGRGEVRMVDATYCQAHPIMTVFVRDGHRIRNGAAKTFLSFLEFSHDLATSVKWIFFENEKLNLALDLKNSQLRAVVRISVVLR